MGFGLLFLGTISEILSNGIFPLLWGAVIVYGVVGLCFYTVKYKRR